ncbi:MAG TPA: guanylate kinase [Bryobacteraceae bacterium]|nr:guanylate kinase [Bryobacteraceae bacterium]
MSASPSPLVFVISAPSGSGKSTLVHRILRTVPRMMFSISYSTREPRSDERDGESYHFITREEFEQRLGHDEFLEHANVFGNYYGTSRLALADAAGQGKDLVLDIDVQGARQLKGKLPEAVTIFVLPPSREVLEQRLRARSQDSDEVIERRLRGAAEEVRNYKQYDYVLINKDLDECAAALEAVIRTERLRRIRMEQAVQPILESFGAVVAAKVEKGS